MIGQTGEQQQPRYLTKILTTGSVCKESAGAGMQRRGKGEDTSSINALLQQIRTQASQGNTQKPSK